MPRVGTVPSRESDKFVVRFPEEMRDRISQIAQENHRSMNSEIVMRLDLSLVQDGMLNKAFLQLSDTELSLNERELLMQFRQLSQRQQNALIALIEHDTRQDSEHE